MRGALISLLGEEFRMNGHRHCHVIPPRTLTKHKLITTANVFVEYPPYDMQ